MNPPRSIIFSKSMRQVEDILHQDQDSWKNKDFQSMKLIISYTRGHKKRIDHAAKTKERFLELS